MRGHALELGPGRCPGCGRALVVTVGEAVATSRRRAPRAIEPGLDIRAAAIAWRESARLRLSRFAERWLTPARLTAIAGLLFVAVTVAWSWRAYRYRASMAELMTFTQAGAKALDEGRLDDAVRALDRAAKAAKTVGLDEPIARRAWQLSREARVWWRLSPTELIEFFEEHSLADGEATRRAFAKELAGRSLVFDGTLSELPQVAPLPDEDGGGNSPREAAPALLVFDWGWQADAYAVEVCFERQWPLAARAGERIIFGAVLKSLDPVSPGGTQWRVRVDPASVTLLTAAAPVARYHWPDEASWAPILTRQRGEAGLQE